MENLIAEGQDLSTLQGEGELRLYLKRSLYQDEIDQLEQAVGTVVQDARILRIQFQKTMDVGAITAVTNEAGLLGWQLFGPTGTPVWVWIAGALGLIYVLRGKRGKR